MAARGLLIPSHEELLGVAALASHSVALAPAARTGVDLLSLALNVSDDQKTWCPVDFESESPAYLDKQVLRFAVEINEDSTRYGQFRRTFDPVVANSTESRQLVQICTL
ncbi:hypothetical protein [Streptomyces sp. NPDC055036]